MSTLSLSIGFTGTRRGMSEGQKERLIKYLDQLNPRYFHHGGAKGADKEAYEIARNVIPGIVLICWPCNLKDQQDFDPAEQNVIHAEQAPLERNRDIVHASDILLAAPGEDQEQLRSGTWSTVRYAKKLRKNVVLIKRGVLE